jgi:membrane protein YdbS with pleckstrin-like domain
MAANTMKLPFTLQADETPALVLRRHWLHLYPRLVLLILLALVPVALWVGTEMLTDLTGTPRLIGIVASVLWSGFWLVRSYFLWYRYQHDVWALTNQRLVDSLRRHWFHHQMSSADLLDIQDVSVEREGPLRTMFDFGDVRVQTAGQQANFLLGAIPHPAQVLSRIDAMRDEARRSHARLS